MGRVWAAKLSPHGGTPDLPTEAKRRSRKYWDATKSWPTRRLKVRKKENKGKKDGPRLKAAIRVLIKFFVAL